MSADLHTLAGAYVLHALPSDEVRFFEAHLTACDACRDEVRELRATTAILSAMVAERPPDHMRDEVMAAVDVTRQLPALPPEAQERPERSTLARLTAVAAGLLLVAVVALGSVVTRMNARVNDLQEQAAETYDVLSAPDVTTVELTGRGDAHGRMVLSAEQERAVVVTDGLPALDENRTYQLWLIAGGGPMGAGLLRPGEDGQAVHRLTASDLSDVQQIAVTVEPAGGSPQPTTDPVLAGEL